MPWAGQSRRDSALTSRVERVDRFRIRRVRFTPIPKKEHESQPSVVRVLPFAGAAMMTRVSAELSACVELLELCA